MPIPVRRLARRLLERLGLMGPYYRWRERRSVSVIRDHIDDGRPMPPPELVVLVSGPSRQWFSERGREDAEGFAGLAAGHGVKVADGIDVLDFGCGAGRIARWLAPEVIAAGGTFTGSDLNPRLAGWCAANLQGQYLTNGLQPPLALETGSVDLAYAHSVLTHLTVDTTRAWLAELARVLRPGALALLTFHDEDYAQAWGPPEVRARLGREPYVVWNNALEGSNYLSAWTTRAELSAMARPWFVVEDVQPGRAEAPVQAVAILRAPG